MTMVVEDRKKLVQSHFPLRFSFGYLNIFSKISDLIVFSPNWNVLPLGSLITLEILQIFDEPSHSLYFFKFVSYIKNFCHNS